MVRHDEPFVVAKFGLRVPTTGLLKRFENKYEYEQALAHIMGVINLSKPAAVQFLAQMIHHGDKTGKKMDIDKELERAIPVFGKASAEKDKALKKIKGEYKQALSAAEARMREERIKDWRDYLMRKSANAKPDSDDQKNFNRLATAYVANGALAEAATKKHMQVEEHEAKYPSVKVTDEEYARMRDRISDLEEANMKFSRDNKILRDQTVANSRRANDADERVGSLTQRLVDYETHTGRLARENAELIRENARLAEAERIRRGMPPIDEDFSESDEEQEQEAQDAEANIVREQLEEARQQIAPITAHRRAIDDMTATDAELDQNLERAHAMAVDANVDMPIFGQTDPMRNFEDEHTNFVETQRQKYIDSLGKTGYEDRSLDDSYEVATRKNGDDKNAPGVGLNRRVVIRPKIDGDNTPYSYRDIEYDIIHPADPHVEAFGDPAAAMRTVPLIQLGKHSADKKLKGHPKSATMEMLDLRHPAVIYGDNVATIDDKKYRSVPMGVDAERTRPLEHTLLNHAERELLAAAEEKFARDKNAEHLNDTKDEIKFMKDYRLKPAGSTIKYKTGEYNRIPMIAADAILYTTHPDDINKVTERHQLEKINPSSSGDVVTSRVNKSLDANKAGDNERLLARAIVRRRRTESLPTYQENRHTRLIDALDEDDKMSDLDVIDPQQQATTTTIPADEIKAPVQTGATTTDTSSSAPIVSDGRKSKRLKSGSLKSPLTREGEKANHQAFNKAAAKYNQVVKAVADSVLPPFGVGLTLRTIDKLATRAPFRWDSPYQ